MILITGGAFQGKETFARRTFGITDRIADGAAADREELKQARLMTHFHLWVSKQLKEKRDPQYEIWQILQENPELVITVTELGCGIVPMDAFDRQWRECVGRVCCDLAEEAEAVFRLTCGIAVKIK